MVFTMGVSTYVCLWNSSALQGSAVFLGFVVIEGKYVVFCDDFGAGMLAAVHGIT